VARIQGRIPALARFRQNPATIINFWRKTGFSYFPALDAEVREIQVLILPPNINVAEAKMDNNLAKFSFESNITDDTSDEITDDSEFGIVL
jgi:hypothetical protein